MTNLWSHKAPDQPNDAESYSPMNQVPTVALSALIKPWSGSHAHAKIEKTSASQNANETTSPGSHLPNAPNAHPLADNLAGNQRLFLECLHMLLVNPGRTPLGIVSVLITQQASFMKKVIIAEKQQSETNNNNNNNNHGREPLAPDEVSVSSNARTDPGPRIQDEYKDVNSAASAPAQLTTSKNQPSLDSVVSDVSADEWDTDRIDPALVEAQKEIINRQDKQIQDFAAKQQENQETIGQLAAQQQENQETIGQLLTEQQASQQFIDQQQTELLGKLEAAHAQQVQLVQKHNEDVAKLYSNKDEMMAIIEGQHVGLKERDWLLKGQKIEHAERLVQLAMGKRSEATATSLKNPVDNKDNKDNSESDEVTIQDLANFAKRKPPSTVDNNHSGRNQHNNRKKNQQRKKTAKHKDGSIGSNTTSQTRNQSKHKEVPVVYDWDTDWDGTPLQKTLSLEPKPL